MVRGRGEEVRAAVVNFSARRCCHKATRAPLPHCVISFLYDVTSQLHQFALSPTPSSALTARSTECRSRCTRDNIPSHIVSLCSPPNDERTAVETTSLGIVAICSIDPLRLHVIHRRAAVSSSRPANPSPEPLPSTGESQTRYPVRNGTR